MTVVAVMVELISLSAKIIILLLCVITFRNVMEAGPHNEFLNGFHL